MELQWLVYFSETQLTLLIYIQLVFSTKIERETIKINV